MKKKLLLIVLCLACVTSFAQTKKKKGTGKPAPKQVNGVSNNAVSKQSSTIDTSKKITEAPVTPDAGPVKPFDRPLDGYYKKTNIQNNKVTPYANVRESDVVFAKRVWEEIDLREKVNSYLGSPKARLIDALMDAVAAGELTAYDPIPTKDDPNGDSFATPLTPAKAKAKMVDSTAVDKFDPKTGEKISSKMQAGEFVADSIVKFRIKEDWLFDKQRSVWEPRIIGIAPMIKQKVAGLNLDYQPAFWIYFPAARQVLVTKEAFNRSNDATDLSFDDVFLKRLFHGYIVKQSNDKDERIKDYATGIDRLYESERIKKSLMDWELNLWQY
ncbi:gliding motility protein GldN [Mucilaginibacter sp.]|uniref:type IX secretion system ring protein PorN/GldN n=1 Tax=Mucilaginibacter sp. TaxID=1882438 RepID=UPI0026256C17|nr:gliding motility protein GldN [Mucilaginibacter sp.]MDB4925649.1 gldN [Mucilaginibacter sp.]